MLISHYFLCYHEQLNFHHKRSCSLVDLLSNMEGITLVAVVCVSITSIIGAFLWWLRRNDDYWKKRGVPYGPRQSIISLYRSLKTKPLHEIFQESYQTYGRVHGGFEFRTPILTVCEPDLLRDILVKDFHAFNYRRDMSLGDQLLDKMVTILKGEEWKRVRTVITPVFTSRRMRQMAHIMQDCSNTIVETLKKYAEKGEPADFKSIFGAYTMDVIATAAFATKIDSHNDPENIFVKEAKQAFLEPPVWRLVLFFIFPAWILTKLHLTIFFSVDFFKNVILQVIQERRQSSHKYNDFLQLLLEAQKEAGSKQSKSELTKDAQEDESDQYGSVINSEMAAQSKYKTLSEDEIVAQCIIFFVVGYETTASTLGYLAYSLALNPECQEKLIKEVDEAFEKNKELDYDILREMKYLDCCVSETLRMYPSLTRSERTASEDYKLGNTGITIQKGTLVGFNIHAMHYDPDFFPNPEKFDPERFMPENAHHPQYAYLPFGAGPRNCLGMRFALMEIKMGISNVLRHYRIKISDVTKVPLEYRKAQGLLTVNTLPLLVEKREETGL